MECQTAKISTHRCLGLLPNFRYFLSNKVNTRILNPLTRVCVSQKLTNLLCTNSLFTRSFASPEQRKLKTAARGKFTGPYWEITDRLLSQSECVLACYGPVNWPSHIINVYIYCYHYNFYNYDLLLLLIIHVCKKMYFCLHAKIVNRSDK